MRFLGLLMIIAGFISAFGLALYQSDFSGTEFDRKRVFDRSKGGWQNGWKDVDVTLTGTQNPIRIVLEGRILAGEYFLLNTLPVIVSLKGPQGPVLAAQLAINTQENSDSAGAQDRKIRLSLPEFDVIDAGLHTLSVKVQTSRDVSLQFIDAVFLENVTLPDYQFRPIGFGLMVLGGGLFVMSRKRRQKKSDRPDQIPNSPPEPNRPRIKWGRQNKD